MSRLRKRYLAAGIVDAGIASVATFVAGFTGVRLLNDIDRGVYGVFFTGFFLGSVIITQLILVPAQIVAVDLPEGQRIHTLRRSLFLALGPSVVALTAALAPAILTRNLTGSPVILALTTTTAITIVVSPMQDHVRQLFHIDGQSWRAVVVSTVQLIAIAGAAVALYAAGVERAWIPFGSLACANIVSLTVGLVMAGAHRRVVDPAGLNFRDLAVSGKWLVVRAATPAAFAFAAANILTSLAGPEAMGYAEAARQVAQPITVLGVGLLAVLGPRAVQAGSQGDRASGRRNRRVFNALLLTGAAGYSALVGFDWSLNPMAWLIPAAYTVGGLVLTTILANLLAGVFTILARELLGARQARPLAFISLLASPALPLAALSAGATGALARPFGYVAEGTLRLAISGWWLHAHQRNPVSEMMGSADSGLGNGHE